MRNEWMSRTSRWVAILLLCMINAVLLAAPVHAAAQMPHAAADTVTLTLDNPGTTFIYGQTPGPTFTAVVTFGTKPTWNHYWTVSGKTDGGGTFDGNYSPIFSPDGMTMTFSGMVASFPIQVGLRTATASFTNPETNVTTTSNSVQFTVYKATAGLSCSIDGTITHFIGAGQTLHVAMAPSYTGYIPVDGKDGTYTVTFDGPTHKTYPNLVSDSNDRVTVPGPTQIGKYLLSCAFSGTDSFTSATYADTHPYTVSAMHSPSSVQLFTNPTTLVTRQNLDFYVVFHAAPGLPTPTGTFQIWIGPYYSDSLPLSPNGDYLVHFSPLSSLYNVSKITIKYWGDIYYNEATFNFPLTNPSISGSSSGNGGSGGTQTQATATTSTTGTPGTTATADATPTAGSAGGVIPSATPPAGDTGIFWLIGGLVLLVLAGLGTTGVIVFYQRRRANSPVDAFPAQSSALSGDDTLPFTRYDR